MHTNSRVLFPGVHFLNDVADIRLIGIDEKRPPRVRKEPYIDIFLKLSSMAPKAWCEDFNRIGKQLEPEVKINQKEGLFVEAWVRNMEDIPSHIEKIKLKVAACNLLYIETIRLKELADIAKNAALFSEDGQQGRLNAIIAGLNFSH
jgi:hypothetical protein